MVPKIVFTSAVPADVGGIDGSFLTILLMSSSGNEEDDEQRTIERNEKVPCPRNCLSEEEEEEEEEEECVFFDEKTMRFEKDSQERGEEEEGEEKAARILGRELFAGTMLFAVFARARTLCDADVYLVLKFFRTTLYNFSLSFARYCTVPSTRLNERILSALRFIRRQIVFDLVLFRRK